MTEDIDLNEMGAQYGPGGPIATATQWVEAVLRQHDLAAGWPLMDEGLRRKMVVAWIEANLRHPARAGEDPESLCEELMAAEDPTGHRLWGGFAITQIREFREAWSHVTVEHCGFGTRPRPLAPDLELLLFADTGSQDPVIYAEETPLPGGGIVMRHLPEGGWVVDGFKFGSDING